MTDKLKLKSLLNEFGVGFNDRDNIVICQSGMLKVYGISKDSNSKAEFIFDDHGEFVEIGVE